MPSPHLVFRPGRSGDSDAIADLHALSWATAYRGIFDEVYLAGPVAAERRAFWRRRLAEPSDKRVLILAETPTKDGLAGFVCTLLDEDARWGALIDNLHVAPAFKARGLGRALMRRMAEALPPEAAERPIHLWVLQDNAVAIAAYERFGGRRVGTERKTEPDGRTHPTFRYAWERAAMLAAL